MSAVVAHWANETEVDTWDALVAQNPTGGDFLVTKSFAEAKALVGWYPRYLVFHTESGSRSVALVLERRVPLLGRYWYLPRSPATNTLGQLEAHLEALTVVARAERRPVFGIAVEPPIRSDAIPRDTWTEWVNQHDWVESRAGIQGNENTVIVDITQSDDELLASYDKKCRNMVRRAARDGVEVKEYPATQETFDEMHRLMRQVGGGKGGLMIRPRAYTETYWRGFSERGQGYFFGVEVDGKPALLAFVIRIGTSAFYKDGGSERDRSTPGMSNFLQFESMRSMREQGAKSYDMLGIAPAEATSNDDHPSYELGRFKLSFGPRTSYSGVLEIPIRALRFRAWRQIGERVVSKLHRRAHTDFSLY